MLYSKGRETNKKKTKKKRRKSFVYYPFCDVRSEACMASCQLISILKGNSVVNVVNVVC